MTSPTADFDPLQPTPSAASPEVTDKPLVLVFTVSEQRYGLPIGQVEEVTANVPLRPVPGANDYVAGVFQHRGAVVPAIDMNVLLGQARTDALLSTRIILVRYQADDERDAYLGLIASHATDVRQVSLQVSAKAPSGLVESKFLGRLAVDDDGEMIQLVRPEAIVSQCLMSTLLDDLF